VNSAGKNDRQTILFVSNGYGEDMVAAHIGRAIQRRDPHVTVRGFPTVGSGAFYGKLGLELAGTGPELPSEGFVRSIGDILRDIRHGFFGETMGMGKRLRVAAEQHEHIVCVGDDYILLFSSLFTSHGAERRIFVNIQQSEWYGGRKPFKQHHSMIERLWIKRFSRLIFVRDAKTRDFLVDRGLTQVRCCGNPMMDCFTIHEHPVLPRGKAVLGILPGSKQEAYVNLSVAMEVARILSKGGMDYTYAIALSPHLSVERIVREHNLTQRHTGGADSDLFQLYSMDDTGAEIIISQSIFGDIINESVALLGTSGTGNEQAAGLGKPVFGYWGNGPQITKKFMKAQKKLLGPSLILSPPQPELIARRMTELLSDSAALVMLADNGRKRMEGRGSIECMADDILSHIHQK
jgi:uncharacterized protein (TIGR03492 family)